MKKFKTWIRGLLKTEEITVTFIKKDGSERVMRCTTNPTYIMFKDPAIMESKKERKSNNEVLPVYDIEADAWRSFRYDSIKKVSIILKDKQ
jgi:hypothetical protein